MKGSSVIPEDIIDSYTVEWNDEKEWTAYEYEIGKQLVPVVISDGNGRASVAHWKVYGVVKTKLIKARTVFADATGEIYVRNIDLNLEVFNFQPGSNLSTLINPIQDLECELGVKEGSTSFKVLEDDEWL